MGGFSAQSSAVSRVKKLISPSETHLIHEVHAPAISAAPTKHSSRVKKNASWSEAKRRKPRWQKLR